MKVFAFVAFLALASSVCGQPTSAPLMTLPSGSRPSVAVSPPAYLGSPQAATGSGSGSGSGSSAGLTDADILYFAYQLEVFEAQFYSCLAFGTGISSDLLGGGPSASGCTKGNLSSTVATYAAELAAEETAHTKLLYTALTKAGLKPVAPAVNINTAFSAAANAVVGSTLSPTFDPTANDLFFLHAAFLFEDLGASAYLGAASLIKDPSYLLTGAQIGNAESYHASLIRTLLFQVINTATPYNLTVGQLTSQIVATLNKLAGAPQVKYGLQNNNGSSISNVDSQGLVPAASAKQVLATVTLGAPAGQGGGFFPNNLNGNIKN